MICVCPSHRQWMYFDINLLCKRTYWFHSTNVCQYTGIWKHLLITGCHDVNWESKASPLCKQGIRKDDPWCELGVREANPWCELGIRDQPITLTWDIVLTHIKFSILRGNSCVLSPVARRKTLSSLFCFNFSSRPNFIRWITVPFPNQLALSPSWTAHS